MSRDVFAGRNTPNQLGYSPSATPASAIVGTFGSAEARFGLFTASASSLPSWICGSTIPTGPTKKSIRPANDLGDHFRGSSEGNMNNLDSRADPEAFRAQMRSAPRARRSEIEHAGFGLCGGDKVARGLKSFGRRNNQHIRRDAEWDNCRKIARRVVAQILSAGSNGVRCRVYKERVAIRIRLGDKGRGDGPSRAGAVFHDDWLTELGRELIANHTRHNVNDAAGRKRHNRLDRSGRPSLCIRLDAREGKTKNRQRYR